MSRLTIMIMRFDHNHARNQAHKGSTMKHNDHAHDNMSKSQSCSPKIELSLNLV